MGEPRLCYVDGPFAYFTTRELSKQWGDDWNDAPYEHNAGRPYDWHSERDGEKWEISRLAWEADLQSPAEMAPNGNSRYSVEQINAGAVAWLCSYDGRVIIPAGTTIPRFIELVQKAGGTVYQPLAATRSGLPNG